MDGHNARDLPLLDRNAPAQSSFASNRSMVSLVRDRPSCCTVLYAFTVWAVYQFIVSITFIFTWIVQQLVVLFLRPCGGRSLTFVLRLWAPLMSSLCAWFVTTNTCEPCYGAEIGDVESFDDFLQHRSASRRKNIRRNLKAAEADFQRLGIEVSYHPAGTWRLTSEMRTVIWEQCRRHDAKAYGYSDILNCGKPVSPRIMYLGEIFLILAFPCDIQVFRCQGAVISINTQVRVGDTYWNPNYATVEEYSRCGIYAWSSRYQLSEAIRLRLRTLNVMPSMRSAKGALGLRALSRCALLRAAWSCARRAPREVSTQEQMSDADRSPQPAQQGKGGKRAARKKAAAAAAENAGDKAVGAREREESSETGTTCSGTHGTWKSSDASDAAPETVHDHVIITSIVDAKANDIPKGGKRAARKKAAKEAAEAATSASVPVGSAPKPFETAESDLFVPNAQSSEFNPV